MNWNDSNSVASIFEIQSPLIPPFLLAIVLGIGSQPSVILFVYLSGSYLHPSTLKLNPSLASYECHFHRLVKPDRLDRDRLYTFRTRNKLHYQAQSTRTHSWFRSCVHFVVLLAFFLFLRFCLFSFCVSFLSLIFSLLRLVFNFRFHWELFWLLSRS